MINFRKKIFLFLTIIGLVAILAGCAQTSDSVRVRFAEQEYEIRMHDQVKIEPIIKTANSMSVQDVELVYESADESIVKFIDGWLYPQAEGETEIKVYWKDKEVVFDKATVRVIKPALPVFVYSQNTFFKNEVKALAYDFDYNYTQAVATFESLNPDVAQSTTLATNSSTPTSGTNTYSFNTYYGDSLQFVYTAKPGAVIDQPNNYSFTIDPTFEVSNIIANKSELPDPSIEITSQ